jgi:hypothetical protein
VASARPVLPATPATLQFPVGLEVPSMAEVTKVEIKLTYGSNWAYRGKYQLGLSRKVPNRVSIFTCSPCCEVKTGGRNAGKLTSGPREADNCCNVLSDVISQNGIK